MADMNAVDSAEVKDLANVNNFSNDEEHDNDDNSDNDSLSRTSTSKLKIDDVIQQGIGVNGHAETETNVDDESDTELDAEAAAAPATRGEVKRLENKVNYMTHQVYRVMLALNVPTCPCNNCASTHEHQNRLILKTTDASTNSQSSQNAIGQAFSNMISPKLGNTIAGLSAIKNSPSSMNTINNEGEIVSGDQTAPRSARWATPDQRLAIAQFAANYGASAASRKFGIPTAAASYCHRKVFQRPLPKGRRPMAEMAEAEKLTLGEHATSSGGSPLGTTRSPSLTSSGLGAGSAGKVRGRPRLIGDELDAELIEHLRNLRKQNNWPRLSAMQILNIATDFIRSRAPGLLAEDGGHIVLKLTWANTVMQRLNAMDQADRFGAGFGNGGAPTQMRPTINGHLAGLGITPAALLNSSQLSRGSDYADPGSFNEGEEDENNDDEDMDDFDEDDAFDSKNGGNDAVNFSDPTAAVH